MELLSLPRYSLCSIHTHGPMKHVSACDHNLDSFVFLIEDPAFASQQLTRQLSDQLKTSHLLT